MHGNAVRLKCLVLRLSRFRRKKAATDVTRAKYADAVHKSECKSTELLAHACGQHRAHETTCTPTPGSAATLALCLLHSQT